MDVILSVVVVLVVLGLAAVGGMVWDLHGRLRRCDEQLAALATALEETRERARQQDESLRVLARALVDRGALTPQELADTHDRLRDDRAVPAGPAAAVPDARYVAPPGGDRTH
ncbi:MAG: hypothetical protein HY904_07075 [Deltaproteobacteria bacterium]|nr:hypothetical protein [Deltaproteobacteria bacterium]